MSQDPELPPYFGISPDEALRELGAPVGTRDFATIAGLCARGRDDLVSRGHDPGGAKRLRRFSTWEIARYLIPVAPAHFRRVLRVRDGDDITIAGPDGVSILDFGDGDGSVTITKQDGEITISPEGDVQVNDLADVFGSLPDEPPTPPSLPDFDEIYQCFEDASG